MGPTPDEGLRMLGARFRAARMARGVNQRRAAEEAGVSRGNLAMLENGGNVSVRFMLKVAQYLEITDISFVTAPNTAMAPRGVNVVELLNLGDVLELLAGYVRDVAVESALPPLEHADLSETPVLKDFLTRHMSDAGLLTRLEELLFRSPATLQKARANVRPDKPEVGTQRPARRAK